LHSDVVISVENLGKRYSIRHQRDGGGGYQTFRETITARATAPMRALKAKLQSKREKTGNGSPSEISNSYFSLSTSKEDFWALKDVSFEVKRGEVLGIIGRNGAGKTTLLKILSRITEPTEGRVRIKGRVASLLEVGTGFHPELTGRENIYLNGAILGMSKGEIRKKFDEIVAFAETEKFLDTPVKRYSSGMYVRLAFAVAAHLEPEILVVDEVLAVGDVEFQKKCLGKMQDVSTKEGRTVLFVSHNMAAITKLCQDVILVDAGALVRKGSASDVVSQYLGAGLATASSIDLSRRTVPTDQIIIESGFLTRDGITPIDEFLFGENMQVRVTVRAKERVPFSVELLLRDDQGLPIAFSPGGLGFDSEFALEPNNSRTIVCHLQNAQLAEGSYSFDVILAHTGVGFYDYIESGLRFRIAPTVIASRNWPFRQSRGQGSVLLSAKQELL
jgi:lipopolysaccharide transport system ATP-binding protein